MGALCLALRCSPVDCFVGVDAGSNLIADTVADSVADAAAGPSLRPVPTRRSRRAASGE